MQLTTSDHLESRWHTTGGVANQNACLSIHSIHPMRYHISRDCESTNWELWSESILKWKSLAPLRTCCSIQWVSYYATRICLYKWFAKTLLGHSYGLKFFRLAMSLLLVPATQPSPISSSGQSSRPTQYSGGSYGTSYPARSNVRPIVQHSGMLYF